MGITYIDSMVFENIITGILSFLVCIAMGLILMSVRLCSKKEEDEQKIDFDDWKIQIEQFRNFGESKEN